MTAAIFWPMYLPLLLSRPAAPANAKSVQSEPLDEMAAAIAEVDLELDAALSSLDGWAENVLENEPRPAGRAANGARGACRSNPLDGCRAGCRGPPVRACRPARSLCRAAREQSNDHDNDRGNDRPPPAKRNRPASERGAIGRRAAKIVRRPDGHAGLDSRAGVDDPPGEIHRAPASRAEELVAQIAAAVEGISAASLQTIELPPDFSTRRPDDETV